MEDISEVHEYVKNIRPLHAKDISKWDYNKISEVVSGITSSSPIKRKGLQEISLNTFHGQDRKLFKNSEKLKAEDHTKAEALTMTGMGNQVKSGVEPWSSFPTTPMPQNLKRLSDVSGVQSQQSESPHQITTDIPVQQSSVLYSSSIAASSPSVHPIKSSLESFHEINSTVMIDTSPLPDQKLIDTEERSLQSNYHFQKDSNKLPDFLSVPTEAPETSSTSSLVEWYKQRLQKERAGWKVRHSELVSSQDRLLAERLEVEEQLKDSERASAKMKSSLDKVTSQLTCSDIQSQQLLTMKSELDSTRRRVRELQQSKQCDGTSLRRRCESAESLCSELKSEIAALQERSTHLQEELSSKVVEIKPIQESNQALRLIESDLHNKVSQLSSLLSETKASKGASERELQMLQLELSDAKFEATHSAKRLSSAVSAVEESNKELTNLREAKSEATTANCELTMENQHLQQKISSLTEDLNSSNNRYEQVNANLKRSNNISGKMESEVDILRVQLRNLEQQYKGLVTNNETRISDIQQRHTTEINQLKEQYDSKVAVSDREHVDLCEELESTRVRLLNEVSAHSKTTNHMQVLQSQFSDERAAAQNQLESLEIQFQQEKKTNTQTVSKYNDSVILNNDLVVENKKISSELELIQMQLRTENSHHSETTESLNTASLTINKLQSQVREYQTKLSNVSDQYESLIRKNTDLSFTIEDTQLRHSESVNSLELHIKELVASVQTFKQDSQSKKTQCDKLTKANTELSFNLQDTRLKHSAAMRDLEEKSNEKITTSESQTNKLSDKLRELEKHVSELLSSEKCAQQSVVDEKTLHSATRKQLEKAIDVKNDLEHQFQNECQSHSSTKQDLNSIELEQATNVNQLADLSLRIAQLQHKLETSESLLRDTEAERSAAMNDLFASKESQSVSECTVQELRIEISSLNTSLSNNDSALRTVQSNLSVSLKQKSDLEERLRKLTFCNENAQNALVELDKLTEMHLKERSLRRKYYNQLVELRGNMRVVCRLKPLLSSKSEMILSTDEETVEVQNKVSGKPRAFRFDDIISPDATQRSVFKSSAEDLIQSLLDGYNICIMAYGQTGLNFCLLNFLYEKKKKNNNNNNANNNQKQDQERPTQCSEVIL